MKIKKESDSKSNKPSIIKTKIIRKKTQNLNVSKLEIQNRKKFEEAKNLISKMDGSESSFSEDNLRELSLADIMKAIDELSSAPNLETKCITECSNQMSHESEIFWKSPRAILKAIKYSIVRRNWDDITHLLLLLLHHKEQYLPVIRKLCLFISKFNPFILKCGLKQEFEMLSESRRSLNRNKFDNKEKL